MRNTGLSKGMLRQLEKLEAASKEEWFDSLRVVFISAQSVEPAPTKETSNLDRDLGADQDVVAQETGNPEPIAVQEIAMKEMVHDWYVEADSSVSRIVRRFTSDLSDEGRNYRCDAMGEFSEDLGLERNMTRPGPGVIIWVATKSGTKPFPTKIGTRILKYV